MQVKFERVHEDAFFTPDYATDGAACFDLYAVVPETVGAREQFIPPRVHATVRTGLAFEVPKGHVMLIYSRSGHGFKHGIRLSNCVGVIDSDYRGEVCVSLHNDGASSFTVKHGDRIAQAMIVPLPTIELVEVHSLSETARGEGGFGSTGR